VVPPDFSLAGERSYQIILHPPDTDESSAVGEFASTPYLLLYYIALNLSVAA